MSAVDSMFESTIEPTFLPAAKEAAESPTIQAIINQLSMMPHPEGGYFVETDRDTLRVPNPFLTPNSKATDGKDLTRSASTSIFYLLTPSSPQGHFHRNKGRTVHTLHKGRGRYVLIHADEQRDATTTPVRVETFVVGQDIQRGERLQWVVEGGKYKASFLLADGEGPGEPPLPKSEEGLLISETVVPGFEFADHDFLRSSRLKELVTDKQHRELEWLLLRETNGSR
ncbi:MAG: hypothetical protein Q9202_005445 [Teloschistes flavicans]